MRRTVENKLTPVDPPGCDCRRCRWDAAVDGLGLRGRPLTPDEWKQVEVLAGVAPDPQPEAPPEAEGLVLAEKTFKAADLDWLRACDRLRVFERKVRVQPARMTSDGQPLPPRVDGAEWQRLRREMDEAHARREAAAERLRAAKTGLTVEQLRRG